MEIKSPSEEYLKTVLCYPSFNANLFSERLRALKRLGVSELLSQGPSSLSRWRILGKGHVGIVVAAKCDGIEVALKILRTDAERPTMEREGMLLAYANTIGVGPKIVGCSRDFLLSELIEGESLMSWVQSGGNLNYGQRCARTLIFQGYRLDLAGIDHGELSRPDKHILVQAAGNPVILDFESASITRRCNNLPSLVQFLFIRRTSLREAFSRVGQVISKERLLTELRAYKFDKSPERFHDIMKGLGLE